MNNDPLKNFVEKDSKVYFRRELVALGDSIKLNYGRGPEDCPYLWQYMKEYSEQSARIFHGFRIDNCHSTPIHMAEYFLKAARAVRPALYVVAELFTGSEDLDHIFVNRLGITSLIREAQNAPDSHEQGRFVHRFGGDPVGAFRGKSTRPAPFSVAHALFYDQTHDNPAPAEKRTTYDYVPTAAMISAAFCAAASSRGYDEFIPFHVHVVHEKRLYRKWSQMAKDTRVQGMIKARALFNHLHVDLVAKGYTEIFVDQYNADVVAITRHNLNTHESVLIVSHCAFGAFKWAPDGHEHKGTPVADAETLTGLQNLDVEIYEKVPLDKSLAVEIVNNVIMFKNFPSSAAIAFKIDPRPETTESCAAVDKPLRKAFDPLDIDQFNYLLFRSEKEVQVEHGSDAYDIPSYGKFVYCGLKGIEPAIRKIQETNDLAHPVCGDLRVGTWLCSYIVGRLRRVPELQHVANLFEHCFTPLDQMPHFLRPCHIELIYSYIYNVAENVLLEKLGAASKLPYNISIVQTRGLVSISFLSTTRDALLLPIEGQQNEKSPSALAAGLPHFATGVWRNWGRDTFFSLPGLLLTNSRFVEARSLILACAGTLRHGLIPNLLAEGKCARYNCRDAVWFWLASILRYIEKSEEGKGPLRDTIYEALNRHFAGIHFRERNAGHAIDEHMRDVAFNVDAFICPESGLVYGDNALNCGTWMDKMGSSDRANNRGLPYSPRDGAAVELQGLALFVAESLAKLNADGHDYDNDGYEQKIAKGWNYHQGPEWLWVAGEYLIARLRVGFALRHENPEAWKRAVGEVKERIHRFSKHIVQESPWSLLPELTNRNGAFCPPSCPSQAWSVGCFLETLEIRNKQLASQ